MKQTVRIALITVVIALALMVVIFGIVFGLFFGLNRDVEVPQPEKYAVVYDMYAQNGYEVFYRGDEGIVLKGSESGDMSLIIYDAMIVIGKEGKLPEIPGMSYSTMRKTVFTTYEVRYDLNGGRVAETEGLIEANARLQNCASDTITLLPAAKDGYVFTGWQLSIPKNEDGVMVFTAMFEAA